MLANIFRILITFLYRRNRTLISIFPLSRIYYKIEFVINVPFVEEIHLWWRPSVIGIPTSWTFPLHNVPLLLYPVFYQSIRCLLSSFVAVFRNHFVCRNFLFHIHIYLQTFVSISRPLCYFFLQHHASFLAALGKAADFSIHPTNFITLLYVIGQFGNSSKSNWLTYSR